MSVVRIRRRLPAEHCMKFRRTAHGSHLILKPTQRHDPDPNVISQLLWSPDGSKLVFSIMAEKKWELGLVNADGTGFRFVKNAGLKSDAFGAPEWARDGKSIFCHDL